nr:MAG TPA: hypothetical protein [Caudoviricetes sp.]
MIVSCETLIYRLLCNFFSKTILIHRPRHRIPNTTPILTNLYHLYSALKPSLTLFSLSA